MGHPGGRKQGEETGCTNIYLSSDFFHRIMVPPLALDLSIAISLSNLSSELSSEQYSPLNCDIQYGISDVNICASLRKMKSGLMLSMKFLRQNKFLFIPSMFQEREVIGKHEASGADLLGEAEGEGEEVAIEDGSAEAADWVPVDTRDDPNTRDGPEYWVVEDGFVGKFVCTIDDIEASTDVVELSAPTCLTVLVWFGLDE